MIKQSRAARSIRIKQRVHKKIQGTPNRPRLTVYRSLHHMYAQIVDDSKSTTIVATSTLSKDVRETLKSVKGNKEVAKRLGMHLAQKAIAQNVKKVVFDRNGYMYHGIIKSLADGAREGGLEF